MRKWCKAQAMHMKRSEKPHGIAKDILYNLTAQMLVVVAIRTLVHQNMLVNPFVTDGVVALLFQLSRHLFRTPIPTEFFFHKFPLACLNPWLRLGASAYGLFICLLRAIPASARRAIHF